jgi:hypothetical protein
MQVVTLESSVTRQTPEMQLRVSGPSPYFGVWGSTDMQDPGKEEKAAWAVTGTRNVGSAAPRESLVSQMG